MRYYFSLMVNITIFLWLGCGFNVFGQEIVIKGSVQDTKGKPIYAANVYVKSNPKKGIVSNSDGEFSIEVDNLNDTLIISFISYKSKEVHLSNIDVTKEIFITLEEKSQAIKQVVIIRQDPISEQFAVEKMNKIDIYLNPVSQADPLKAITILPASTNTDETANPSLRGSSSIRSRVVLNGVPIYNPVRFNQTNNYGISLR